MGEYFYLNGKILKASEAMVNITDLALLRGFGVFDFSRTHNKKPFLLEKYIQRFNNSAAVLELEVPFRKEELINIINELLLKNNIYEAGIRMVLTGGYTANGYLPGKPNFFILIENINFPTEENYKNGIKLYFHEHQRELSSIKSINYLSSIALRNKLVADKAFDVLFHHEGKILEVSRSNFFIIKDNTVITPDKDILLGITRESVINLARNHYKVEERNIRVEELWTADEAFMTGTTKKVLPVVQVGDHIIGSGSPGPVTRKLMNLFLEFENVKVAQ